VAPVPETVLPEEVWAKAIPAVLISAINKVVSFFIYSP
jgi:hypothetical protein